ncbi:hypothetical protein DPMN_096987 [Dreissena polymorpha]|uniref:Uncharacterized protein n=1 Tax=Dreissena polymorpha TaxID=45954 RepID=A0A9D4R5Y4_DREPO|nr:hypothetical protein DPMN_096987 [Dreissena polymorpha]
MPIERDCDLCNDVDEDDNNKDVDDCDGDDDDGGNDTAAPLDNDDYSQLLCNSISTTINVTTHRTSSSSGPTDTCKGPPCESKGVKWVGVFMMAQIMYGIGFNPMFTLGTTFLDENSNPQTTAVYVGMYCGVVSTKCKTT